MKFKVNKAGWIKQVKFGRTESGCVEKYGEHAVLCANLHTVLWALEGVDVNEPGLNTPVCGEALIRLWDDVWEEWEKRKEERYLLDFSGLFFKFERKSYMLMVVKSRPRLYTAVDADFVLPFMRAGTHDFYLHTTQKLPSGKRQAVDLATALDMPLIVAVRSELDDLAGFVAPARIPEREMSYLR